MSKEENLITIVNVLQLLRGLLYNEIVKINDNDTPKVVKKYEDDNSIRCYIYIYIYI